MLKRFSLCFLLVVSLVFVTSCSLKKNNSSNKQSDFMYIAHRGIPSKYFESSVEGFKVAAENSSYGAVETDLYLTKDNIPVCVHDTYPFIDNTKSPSDFTYEEISKMPIHGSANFPFYVSGTHYIVPFDTFLKTVKSNSNKPAVFELKAPDFDADGIKAIIELVKKNQMDDRVMVESFNPEILTLADQMFKGAGLDVPSYQLLPITSDYGSVTDKNVIKDFQIEEVKDFIDKGKNVWVGDSKSPESAIWGVDITPDLIDYAHKHNVKFGVWTVDNIDRANELINMGVDSIYTNYIGSDNSKTMRTSNSSKCYLANSDGKFINELTGKVCNVKENLNEYSIIK